MQVEPKSDQSAFPRVLAAGLLAGMLLPGLGCGQAEKEETITAAEAESEHQRMEGLRLAGYQQDGSKQWELLGDNAQVDGDNVFIYDPDGVGYDDDRTAYLTAKQAIVNQRSQRVQLKHDVVMHTSDGVWLYTAAMDWDPEVHIADTDEPVKIESDHILLRGRGAVARTQTKIAMLVEDVELVLNPSDEETPETPEQVFISCDGPLVFDYENNIATFSDNVHIDDGKGELFSDRLIAYLDPESKTINYAEAEGNVKIIQNGNTALSEKAVYEPAYGKMTLLGKPKLKVSPDSDSRQSATIPILGMSGQ